MALSSPGENFSIYSIDYLLIYLLNNYFINCFEMKTLSLINLVEIVSGLFLGVDANFNYMKQQNQKNRLQADSVGVAKRQACMI